jgi:cell cycle sensor histidine kinase DivJ
LSAETTRPGNWVAGLIAGSERLVHPAVHGKERQKQHRLLAALLAGPFILAAAIVQVMMPGYGPSASLALLCAIFGLSWLAALATSARGASGPIDIAVLAGAAGVSGLLVALGGGFSAPLAVLLAALPAEIYWISRSRKAAIAGGALAFASAVVFGQAIAVDGGAMSAWLWATPVLYAATLAARLLTYEPGDRNDAAHAAGDLPEACFGALIARITRIGEVETASSHAVATLGVEPELLLGTGLFERIHVGDRVAFLCTVADVHDSGRPGRCELRIRMPMTADGSSGGYRPFVLEILRAHKGDDTVVAIVRDGGEIAALRDELAHAVEQAGATEVAKSRFLAAVSHELRTPLNAIIGFSDMLLHPEISGELAPKQAEHVQLIGEAGNHLLSVVNAILDVSKIESGSYQIYVEPFDLQPAVEMCRAMLEPQAKAKNIALSVRLPQGLGAVAGDQRAVQQILLNLLSNAIKFTPEGGSVGVSAASQGDMIRIFVNDTGIGLSSEELTQVGRPFVQVHNDYTRQFQGTGLGLSLVKGLVELHKGTMTIESAPGLGTTVTIGLPAAASGEQGGDGTEDEATRGEKGERYGIALRKTA